MPDPKHSTGARLTVAAAGRYSGVWSGTQAEKSGLFVQAKRNFHVRKLYLGHRLDRKSRLYSVSERDRAHLYGSTLIRLFFGEKYIKYEQK